ncbi:MAG TPA: hypothetical protein VII61_02330, partial [Ktedonobacteraceae bacterium]
TVNSVSPSVTCAEVIVTLIAFFVLYGILAVIDGYLLFNTARKGSPEEVTTAQTQEEQLVVTF